jgi:hypothetical protein
MSDKKSELANELDRILQVKDISWGLLPESDLLRLFEAFQRLKQEFEEAFALLDEVLDNPITVVDDTKREWKRYTV